MSEIAVMISVKPIYCELIACRKKTTEVRKTKPKIQTPFKVFIYCTKDEPLYHSGEKFVCNNGEFGNGKVIGEFMCERITSAEVCLNDKTGWFVNCMHAFEGSCLSESDILSYCPKEATVYGWHISDLVIYDEPKMLHHFFKHCGDCDKKGTIRCTEELTDCRAKVITRPPQSWRYVEEENSSA